MVNFLTRFFRQFIKLNRFIRRFSYSFCILPERLTKKIISGSDIRYDAPLRCDGEGTVVLGDNVGIGYFLAPSYGNGEVLLQARNVGSFILIGSNSHLSNCVSIVATQSIKIGSHCLIGDQTLIVDSDFHNVDPLLRSHPGSSRPVVVEDNVWIGARVTILKGVFIGCDSVIAAGSVVTSSIPARSIAAGVPAKVIRTI